jgi:hypothetical protein
MIYELLIHFEKVTSGERGIRTPGSLHFNGFQDRRIRPLCHLSACKIKAQRLMFQIIIILED